MSTVIKAAYGSNNQAMTCTLASLTTTSSRCALAIDNTTNLFEDVLVFLKVKSGASSTISAGVVNVYAYGSADGGTSYTGGAGGTDAGYTQIVPPQLVLIGTINVVANAVTYFGGPFSVAAAFNGVMPDHWGIVIENISGGTLDATGGSHSLFYQGWNRQNV